MTIEITNRDIEKSTNYSLPQVKRWAVALLPSDPEHGQHSGKTRQYSFDDAATIYLAGLLITALKFNIDETKAILKDMREWLKTKGWAFSNFVKIRKSHNLRQKYVVLSNEDYLGWIELEIQIGKDSEGSFIYSAKAVIDRTTDDSESDSLIWNERYRLHYFGGEGAISVTPEKTLYLSNKIKFFANRLCRNL